MLRSHGRYDYSNITRRPDYSWPDGKRLAVYIAFNIEAFAFGQGKGSAIAPPDQAESASVYSWRDYGNRVGVRRLFDMMDELGLPIEAMVSVTVRQAELPRITQAIATLPEVVQAYGMSGQVDLLVRVAARDTQHLFDVDARILAIDGVERTETSLVMGEVIGYRIRPLLESAREDAIR